MWPISTRFQNELRRDSHMSAVKVEVLDTLLNPVDGGTFYDRETARRMLTNDFSNIVVDGSVDVDVTRDIQRTCELTILNQNGEFSPDSKWGGYFYIDRAIRVWRGLIINGEPEWVPIGTFLIDTADVVVERNMSTVILGCSDFWKKMSKSLIVTPQSWAKTATINSVITEVATNCGITGSELSLDPLNDRSADDKKLGFKLMSETGDSRGDVISALCSKKGIDIYFDPMGKLVTQDMTTAKDKKLVWSFYDAPGGMLLTVRRSFSDAELYNELALVGTGNADTIYRRSNAIYDPANPVNVDRIGRRTKIIESKAWKTLADVNAAFPKYWNKYVDIQEEIEIDVIANPALEGNDMISIRETQYTDLGEASNIVGPKYRIKRMTLPLSTSRSKINVSRSIDIYG